MLINKSILIGSFVAMFALNACTKSDPEPAGTTDPANTPPTVDFSQAGNSFVSNASDPDQNDTLTYTWYVDGLTFFGPNLTLVDPEGNKSITLAVNDGTDTVTKTKDFDFGVTNTPPTVSFDRSSNVFIADAYDADGDKLTFQWDVDGVISNGAVLTLTDPYGEKTIKLTASDGAESVSYSETIDFGSPDVVNNLVANFTVDATSGKAPLTVTFNASTSSDESNQITNYFWDFDSNGANDAIGISQSHQYTIPGNYTAKLLITDVDGNQAIKTQIINVLPPDSEKEAPIAVATASQSSGQAPFSIVFSANDSTDADGTITDYAWSVNGENLFGRNVSYEFEQGGNYSVQLIVTDNDGLSSSDTINVSISPANQAPVAIAQSSVTSGPATLDVRFDGSNSTDDGGVNNLTYLWTIDGQTLTGSTVDYSFTSSGTYSVQLTVTDADGLDHTDSLSILVTPQNVKPTAIIVAPVTSAQAAATLSFDGSSSTDDSGVVAYEWSVDGETFSDTLIDYTFTSAGTYSVTLTVTDAQGLTDSTSINVVINDGTGNYNGELPVPQDLVDDAIQDSLQPGELISGNVIYTKIPDGESPLDYPRPRVVTIDEDGNVVEYELPAHHVFDFGGTDYIVLDDFNDADHQNNLGGAVAINHCENYTEGGGYWYVFGDDATSIQNASGLDINAYNIIEAVERGTPGVDQDRYALHVEFNVSEFAGVGTNILFEEHEVDLSNLDYVEITVKGSGTFIPMFEPIEAIKGDLDTCADCWGNYAAYNGTEGTPFQLTGTYQTITLDAADFIGEQYSLLDGDSPGGTDHTFVGDGGKVTKFFFQTKDSGVLDIYIDRIEFFGTGLNVDSMEWKNDEYDINCEGADVENQDVPTLIPNPYIDFTTATITDAGAQMATDVKTAAELLPNGDDNWLHVQANTRRLYDSTGDMVRMTGVNWFGFETKNLIPMGIWEDGRTVTQMLTHIKELGFNTVRIPFSDEVITRSRSGELTLDTLDIDLTANGMNATDTPLDLLDEIIEISDGLGLKVVLDSHSRASDRYLVEGHWVSEFGSEEEWIEVWEFLAARYADQDAVTAFDLNNEPHFEAAWGSADPAMNWNEAAKRAGDAIQAINPNVLIIVEGVEHLNGHQEMDEAQKALDSYWWGGNLKGVADHPITLAIDNTKLVYSPHEYGPEVYVQPWFKDSSFPRNLQYIWEDRFGYIYNQSIGHMFVGEFGIKNNIEGSASNEWFDQFVTYICDRSEGFSFTFWAWNPNSGDTGGILGNDWETVNTWKTNKLSSCLAPMIGNDNG